MLRKFYVLLTIGALSATFGTSAIAGGTRGETVLITVGDKAFAWKFDTFGTPNFSLQEIAPKDFNVQGIRV